VNLPEAKHDTNPGSYADGDDFRRIFHDETDSLYRLAFLLTTDREKAEQCFVSGLEESVNGTSVFREWARSWARRTIIQNAVRVINPRPAGKYAPSTLDDCGTTPAVEQVETEAVLRLEPFERFVYIMSVLERYSDLDCSLLLGCARREVVAARIHTLRQIESQSAFTLSTR
jgi:DNA-directed RNA polymerase specialized sigma24 family protein